MEERFKDMTPYDRAVGISLYSNRVGKMEEQKDHRGSRGGKSSGGENKGNAGAHR